MASTFAVPEIKVSFLLARRKRTGMSRACLPLWRGVSEGSGKGGT